LLQEYHNELLLIYLQELQQQQAKLGSMQSKQVNYVLKMLFLYNLALRKLLAESSYMNVQLIYLAV
jgi:hypothetical protein